MRMSLYIRERPKDEVHIDIIERTNYDTSPTARQVPTGKPRWLCRWAEIDVLAIWDL